MINRCIKLFLFLVFTLFQSKVTAQLQIGIGTSYSFDVDYAGVTARAIYNFNPRWAIQAEFTNNFLPKILSENYFQYYHHYGLKVDLDGYNYNINARFFLKKEKSGFNIYALGGYNISTQRLHLSDDGVGTTVILFGTKPDVGVSTTSITNFFLGFGTEISISKFMSAYVEAREDINNLVILSEIGFLFKIYGNNKKKSK